MAKFRLKYPFRNRIPGVPDQLVTALAANFRDLEYQAGKAGGVVHQATPPDQTNVVWMDTDEVPAAIGVVPLYGCIDYFGTTEPEGWLFPNGQAIDINVYPEAHARFGGAMPDMRGRVGVGLDNMGGVADAGRLGTARSGWNNVLGGAGGQFEVSLAANQGALRSITTNSQNANHWHYSGAHENNGILINAGSSYYNSFGSAHGANVGSGWNNASHQHTTPAADAIEAHDNMQPSMNVNKLVRVK